MLMEHLAECKQNENLNFLAMMKMAYRWVLDTMSIDERNSYPFSLLGNSLKHLPNDFPA